MRAGYRRAMRHGNNPNVRERCSLTIPSSMPKNTKPKLDSEKPAIDVAIEEAVQRTVDHLLSRDVFSREFISIAEISARSTLSKATIWRMQKRGDFPRARKLTQSGGRYAYVRAEVEAWLQERAK